MTTRVNLLPWRDMRRKEQDRQLLSIGIFAWLLMGLVVFYGHHQVTTLIEGQQARNKYLHTQIADLDKVIAKIKDIKKQRSALVNRMGVIYKLQSDRTRMVHIMDALARTLPEGVYYKSMKQSGNNLILTGGAQSNARIAALLRNFEGSQWFANPNLKVVNVVHKGSSRISNFNLTVTQLSEAKDQTKKKEEEKKEQKKKPAKKGKRS
ncbi:MAG: PilN domain-containing protein [Acidiferrobacteraceae bacterium]|jgi:type IV pilus assembly protein PilN